MTLVTLGKYMTESLMHINEPDPITINTKQDLFNTSDISVIILQL